MKSTHPPRTKLYKKRGILLHENQIIIYNRVLLTLGEPLEHKTTKMESIEQGPFKPPHGKL